MSDSRSVALQYAVENHERFLKELKEFVSIPSVSTDPEREPDIKKAAEWVAARLSSIGLQQVQVFPTDKHPVVYAEYLASERDSPTVLAYGHYDVQPAEPLELWESGPFSPEVRGENLYARGASDMKGQVMACMNSIQAIIQAGQFPVNVKFLIEGEEEIGSPNLKPFIAENKDLLACDFALNPDTGMISPDLPTIIYALRGLAYFELRLFGPSHDLHSGTFGGVVHNPAQALCELISGMHDAKGQVTLPGFYDKVRPLTEKERSELARLPMDEQFYLGQTGAPELWGEPEYAPVERTGARPTLEVNGLLSGFTGEGSKTVLPAWAMAKISTRLVPDQDPEEVHQQLLDYVRTNIPKTVRYEVDKLVGSPASISDLNSNGVKAMERALEKVWGKKPLYRREGGSVPVVAQFQEILGIESVNCGFSLQSDNAHGPNEKLHLPTWKRGIDSLIHFFYNVGESVAV